MIPKLTVGTNFYLEERRDIIPEGYEFVREELRDGTFDLTDMGTSEEAIERTLARDESEPGQDFDPSTVGAIKSGVDAESHVYNRKLKEDIPITVEKEWSGIDGNDPALKDASVTVVVGRYILQEKAGNFQIKKTLNVVGDSVDLSDIDFVAKYYIEGTDSSGASRSFGPYWVYSVDSEGGVATVSGTLPPGTYTVREEIVKADGAYIWTNSGSPASLVITDGEDGDPTPVNFSATATVRTGSLKITSTLDDGGSSVSLDGVTYTVLDANGELAKKTDGTPVGAIPYSDLPIVIENLKVGSYTVVENDPPETPENFVLSEKTPLTDRIPVQVTEGSDPVEANFSRVYAPDVVSNTFTVHIFTNGNWAYDYYPNNGQPQNAPLDESGTFSWRPGEPVDFVLYLDNATWNRFNGTQGRDWTATYNGENISLISAQPISSEGVYAYTFRIPEVRADGVLQLGCNAQRNAWRDSKPYELKEVSRSLSMSRSTRKLLSGSPLRDGAKGRDTISPSDYGTAPETDADSLMKYVDDTSYNEEIVLNQGNGWTQILTDRPVQETVDGVSYTYYYYIKSVVETGMPQGTTCSVALNGTEKLLISETNTTTESLSVTNTVPRGSLQITKTARKNDAAGSGTFWYAVYAEEYDPYAATHPAPVSSCSITVGADGTGTDTVSDLLYGTYYVYELDGENGTPIVSNGGSVWHSIGGTVYRVTGSGTTATVQSGTTPTAALQNEPFTVDVSVKKIWVTPANMTAPESIVMRLSNNQEVTLTAPSWQGTISNLPKYDHNGDLIEYSWTEGSMPAGYVLTDQSEADGTTTFTNSYTDSYRPVMEIKGVKVWDDEGDEHRPGSIIVKLYKDGVLYATQTVTAPVEDLDADQWPFRFTNLPIFNNDGTLAQYTIEEELPAGYSGDYKITQEFSTASYEMGDIQGEIVNSGQGSQTFKVSEGVDLGYIVIRHGNDFIIWTPRPATDDEISSIKTKVAALSDQFNGINTASGNSLKIISGVPKTIDVGGERFY